MWLSNLINTKYPTPIAVIAVGSMMGMMDMVETLFGLIRWKEAAGVVGESGGAGEFPGDEACDI